VYFLSPTYIHIIIIITSISYTTHIFQVLDPTLYGVVKQQGQYHLALHDDVAIAEFLIRTDHDLKQAMVDANIRSIF
jgi:hypothetical protein